MRQIGLEPDAIDPANADETPRPRENSRAYALRMAEAKLAAALVPETEVYSSDAVLLGKVESIDGDNVVVTLDRHGNTSAASVPCALDEAVRDGRIKAGQLVLLEAFGGGFTWGSALIRF